MIRFERDEQGTSENAYRVAATLERYEFPSASAKGISRLSYNDWLVRFFVSARAFLRFFLHTQMMPILEGGEETLVGARPLWRAS